MRTKRQRFVWELTSLERVLALSGKAQFGAAIFWSRLHFWLGLPTAALAAVSGATALASQSTLAAVLALGATVLASVTAFLNATEKHKLHHAAGNEYSKLARTIRLWRQFDQPDLTDAEVRGKVDEFQTERDRLNEQSPQVPRLLFLVAKRRVDRDEARRRARADARRRPRSVDSPPETPVNPAPT
jgi:hypothetical protein